MRGIRAIATGLVAPIVVSLALGSVALAGPTQAGGKGGGGGKGPGGGSQLFLVVLEPAGGEPRWGGEITFEIETTMTDRPYVRVDCLQDGEAVYWSSAGFFDDYPWQWAQNFRLSSDRWTGGAADCTAELYHTPDGRRFRTLASIAFHASA